MPMITLDERHKQAGERVVAMLKSWNIKSEEALGVLVMAIDALVQWCSKPQDGLDNALAMLAQLATGDDGRVSKAVRVEVERIFTELGS